MLFIRMLRNNGGEYLSDILYEISLVMISAVMFKYVNCLIVRSNYGWKTISVLCEYYL